MNLKINNTFKNLIPPLTTEEYEGLKNSILEEGCRDAIITWHDTIIDGHNRYEICQKNNILFDTIEFSFDSEFDVTTWIIQNQFSRRNLSSYNRSLLALKLETLFKEKAKENQGTRTDIIKSNNDNILQKSAECYVNPIDTRAELAKIAGVSHDTISKVKQIELKASPEIKEKLQTQEFSINQAFQEIRKEEKLITLEKKKEEYKAISNNGIKEKPIIENSDVVEFLNKQSDNSIDLLITDPPYSTDISNINEFVNNWLPVAISKVKPNGRAFICIGAYPNEIQAYFNVLLSQDKFILDSPLIWTYRNTLGVTPKMKYNLNYQMILHLYSDKSEPLDTSITNEMFSVQDINAPDGRIGNRLHSWQKPDELADRLIRHASKPNDLVVDCFAGTGTFLLSASKYDRIAKGTEININTLDIAKERGCSIITGR